MHFNGTDNGVFTLEGTETNVLLADDNQSTFPDPDYELNQMMQFNGAGNSLSTLIGALGLEGPPNEAEHAAFPGSLLRVREILGLLTGQHSIDN
ncbi:hypothetical protein BKA82DRAFT_850348 [Pisolithus tinctorius]|uniref:Uncharacterized protein n=1 Tax=Pisolithus tinctorius Marx 270 TaxID=870435 RepID=A0A0C3NSU4_PISTI|nr:hypothetical protein BKA82DRAFT_850348 [Pisolithus tinctorius]KIN98575.1 hypothetical protein M404DRAFT_850348 [Pisolithus tinctorius Marx 270]